MKDLATKVENMATAMPEKGVAATRIWLVVAISMAVMLADQIMKIWVKTNFYMGEDLSLIHI